MCLKPALAATFMVLLSAPAWAAKPAPRAAPQASQAPAARAATAEDRAEADRMDPLARATFWTGVADADPRDAVAGIKLAKALRELTRYDEAVAAAERVLVVEPANLEALLECARDHIAAGQGFFAIDPAQRAAAIAPRDWRPVSLLAVALEQSQRDDEALVAHQKALALAPDNPAAMSNLAMYLAAHDQTAQAEALLRRAAAEPGATAQERLNLALLLGLGGHVDEAARLERRDLPPATVDNNLAYLRGAPGPAARSWNAMKGTP